MPHHLQDVDSATDLTHLLYRVLNKITSCLEDCGPLNLICHSPKLYKYGHNLILLRLFRRQ
jgi:hypothetical protein